MPVYEQNISLNLHLKSNWLIHIVFKYYTECYRELWYQTLVSQQQAKKKVVFYEVKKHIALFSLEVQCCIKLNILLLCFEETYFIKIQ